VDRLEAAARRFYGVPYALGVNSGTGALITALRALGIGPGAEVIVPAFLWVASVGAVVQVGAIPVLCEVDDSFCMDPADLKRKISSRTRLILPIHMAGAPCDMAGIMRVAEAHGLPVLEDCAQCNGGSFRGRRVGTWGDIGIFSLQLNKNMTSGEGGLLITRSERLYERAFSAHDMGLVRVAGRLAVPEPDAILWGGGRRMTELCGAVASVQLRRLPRIVAHMRASRQRIEELLAGVPGLAFRRQNDPAGDTACFLILILDSAEAAGRATERLLAAGMHNVKHVADYGMHVYSNIPSLVNKVPLSPAGDPWSLAENRACRAEYAKGTCPRSDELFARSVLIPIPSRLTRAQERAAAGAIRQAVAE
jgi:8-amino-3,8-dideoxy-alpha-D-manno-octulosonate transaminase